MKKLKFINILNKFLFNFFIIYFLLLNIQGISCKSIKNKEIFKLSFENLILNCFNVLKDNSSVVTNFTIANNNYIEDPCISLKILSSELNSLHELHELHGLNDYYASVSNRMNYNTINNRSKIFSIKSFKNNESFFKINKNIMLIFEIIEYISFVSHYIFKILPLICLSFKNYFNIISKSFKYSRIVSKIVKKTFKIILKFGF